MIGAIGTFFQVAGQIGQAIHAVRQAVGGDGEESQDGAGAAEARAGNAVQRSIEINGATGQRVVVTTTTRPDGRVITRRDAAGSGAESFANILSAVAARSAGAVNSAAHGVDRLAAQAHGSAASGRIDFTV